MTPTQTKIIAFFLRHPDYFLRIISSEYPFSSQQLNNYKELMNWENISLNKAIDWNYKLLNTYADRLDWGQLSLNEKAVNTVDLIDRFENRIVWEDDCWGASIANNTSIKWSIEVIDKYKSKLDFNQLALNPKVPWSQKLIDRYFDRWDFSTLSENSGLPWSVNFFNKYYKKSDLGFFLFGYYKSTVSLMGLVETYPDDVDWKIISSSSNLPWHKHNLLEKWRKKIDWKGVASNEVLFQAPGFFESHLDKWLDNPIDKFCSLSYNEGLPWSSDLIDRFLEYWDWEALSQNSSLPWSIEFIKKYEHRLVWGGYENQEHLIHEKDAEDPIIGIYHEGLISNEGLPWSINFLNHYEDKLEFEMLYRNPAVWKKAFSQNVNDEVIETIIKIL